MLGFIRVALTIANMKKNQWKTRAEIEQMQAEKLRALVSYASQNVPHYRRSLSGADEDLKSLPFSTKEEVKNDPDSFLSRMHDKRSMAHFPTSGSSGIPLDIYYDRKEYLYGIALQHHQSSEAGGSPFDKTVYFASSVPDLPLPKKIFFRAHFLSLLDKESKNLDALKKLRPRIIHGYPSVLSMIARENMESSHPLEVKKIFTSSELLSPEARGLIRRSFSADVRDFYGVNEMFWVAWECEKGSMHVHSDSVIVETVDERGNPAGEGNLGNIVLTPLWRHSMPFIRYKIGDLGILGSKCRCGRGTHVIKSLEGREDDFLTLPGGRKVSARSINTMDDLSQIRSYQIVQENERLIVFRYVPMGRALPDDTQREIERKIRKGLGNAIRIEFEMADSIAKGRSGKIRTVISKVKR
jgi:phenylacetate-CoA ligase